ncbi:biopolymer transporter ExbD [Hymenobacter sp. BRD128]|nr:biopolymer transporter ExbD [Hymenobacter sp. BRD128]
MTPMVDLAFLLLTFFMLTTTFAKPRVMQLQMPVKPQVDDQNTPLPASKAMTIILGSGHQAYYYFGLTQPDDPSVPVPTLHTTNFGPKGIRQALLAWGQRRPTPVVLIKAGPRAKYSDMVDILDEMNITGQKKYALTDLTAADRQLLSPSERQ